MKMDAPGSAGVESPAGRRGAALHREAGIRHALRLEYLTIGWNVVEGVIAVTAAVLAGSVALLGFGIDSFVESASGGVLVWRLLAERRGADVEEIERLDGRAHKLVGASLLLLAAYVAFEAVTALWTREAPRPSVVGIALTAVSIVAMQWLARAKRRAARRLRSRALEADAFQTTACFWLSVITLLGVGLNATFDWWWADPIAALGMIVFIAREGAEAWRGEECGCEGDIAALARERSGETSCGCASDACSSGRAAARGGTPKNDTSSCCSSEGCDEPRSAASGPTACPRCGAVGKIVGDETVRAILKPGEAEAVLAVERRFCRTPSCAVLYYGANGRIIEKSASSVRVGVKETEDPVPLCYCFEFTRAHVRGEVAETGGSTIPDRIDAEIRAGRCACERKNPSGACCLGDVRKAVEEAMAELVAARES